MGLLSGVTDFLFGGADSTPAPAADPNIGLAQKELAEISKEYLNVFKTEIWPAAKQTMLKQDARADEQFLLDSQLQKKQIESSDIAMKEYREKGTPLREAIYKEAEQAGGDAEIARQSALTVGDVKSQFGISAEANKRQLQSFGIDPTSGRYQGQNRTAGIMEAATTAAAVTKARDAATQLGWAKKLDAAALAQGQFGNQASSTGLALSAGGQALGAGQTTMGNLNAMSSMYGNAAATANQGWGQVGQLGIQNYGIQSQNWNNQVAQNNAARASDMAFVGSLAGAGAYYGKK